MKTMDAYKNQDNIQDNYQLVLERISQKALNRGDSRERISVVAVTKSHSVEVINQGLKAGITRIGENRVQEAEEKLPFIDSPKPEFHFIGHLQTNKINKLLALQPTLIHSVDSVSLAKSLNNSSKGLNRVQPILIQVNTSDETSKSGFNADYAIISEAVHQISQLEFLKIKGLMTISKLTDIESEIRECFITLRNFFECLKKEQIDNTEFEYLSMGMSDDYLIAIEEGSNMVRLGSAIFGQRNR
jgi:pyridoxal phosphate enzyme (YggS family)